MPCSKPSRQLQLSKNERQGSPLDKSGMPLISVDALKKLVYEKSGYQMQLSSDDDPLLTTVYINQVVLGQAIEYAAEQMAAANDVHILKLEQNYKNVLGQLHDARKLMLDAGKNQSLSQPHLSIKTLPDSLPHAVHPVVQSIKDASGALKKVLGELPEAVKREHKNAFGEIAHEMGEMIGFTTEKTRLDTEWKATGAMAVFGALMLGCGVYVGDNRAGWASPVAFGAVCALGLVAGVAIGYVVSSTLRDKLAAHARAKAFWNDPARRAWHKRIHDALRS